VWSDRMILVARAVGELTVLLHSSSAILHAFSGGLTTLLHDFSSDFSSAMPAPCASD
jgi:hypothetical protein